MSEVKGVALTRERRKTRPADRPGMALGRNTARYGTSISRVIAVAGAKPEVDFAAVAQSMT